MKKLTPILSLLFILLGSHQSFALEKMNLKQCYESALKTSESVEISEQDIQRAQARFTQALGLVLPKITFYFTETLQDPVSGNDSSSVGNTFTRSSRPEAAFNFQQALFRGLREIRSVKLSKVDKSRQQLLKKEAERRLFQDVAIAFFTITQIESEIDSLQKIIRVSKSQLTELEKQSQLGKIRESSSAAQQADLSLLEAELEKKKGERAVSYQMLSFLTGLDPQPNIEIQSPLLDVNRPLQSYLASTVNRPDLLADQTSVKIAKGETKITEGELLPQADLNANIYPYRVGFLKDIHWDAQIQVSVPIFNGVTIGKIQESKLKAKQAALLAEGNRRLALSETKQAYEAFQSASRQFSKYQKASRNSEHSYYLQAEDFKLGLIDNLDVLQSQRLWLEALRARNEAETSAWLSWIKLQLTSGTLP